MTDHIHDTSAAPRPESANLLTPPLREAVRGCQVDGCDRPHAVRGYCNVHYKRTARSTGFPETLTAEERFWARVDKSGDCWEWRGPRDRFGYGYTHRVTTSKRAHRAAYELLVGPIPDGLVLRHTCDNPPCVNPDHLIPGTQRENVQDMHDRGRYVAAGTLITECLRGHAYDDANTYRDKKGHRSCRTCQRERCRRRPAGTTTKRGSAVCPDCGETRSAANLWRHRQTHIKERLS